MRDINKTSDRLEVLNSILMSLLIYDIGPCKVVTHTYTWTYIRNCLALYAPPHLVAEGIINFTRVY